MGALERSLVLFSLKVHVSIINKKCLLLKWLPCSILVISWSRFYQIITKWIFLESKRKELLKIVQYGISRPLGSRENKKNKSVNSFAGHPVDRCSSL